MRDCTQRRRLGHCAQHTRHAQKLHDTSMRSDGRTDGRTSVNQGVEVGIEVQSKPRKNSSRLSNPKSTLQTQRRHNSSVARLTSFKARIDIPSRTFSRSHVRQDGGRSFHIDGMCRTNSRRSESRATIEFSRASTNRGRPGSGEDGSHCEGVRRRARATSS